jgi:putative transposase
MRLVLLHSRRLSVSRMRENLAYGLMRGRWKRTTGLLDRDTRPKGEKRLGVAGPYEAPRHCSTLQLRNLLAKAPAHLPEELAEDYRRMVYADTRESIEQERVRFLRKWRLRCKAVVSSFEEAGDELFTFLQFPQSQWKALRTTNALERINEEFRRRTKTQASLPDEDSVLLLLYGLLRSGQIVLRRIDGRNDLPKPKPRLKAA